MKESTRDLRKNYLSSISIAEELVKKMLKIGFDFHGVLDTHSKMFAELSKIFVANGCEVHVITGSKITPKFQQELIDLGIQYTHIFSIVDYHESIGTPVQYDERGPWIDADLWNRTKADYCSREGINLHIDDSDEYGKFFKNTAYLQIIKPE